MLEDRLGELGDIDDGTYEPTPAEETVAEEPEAPATETEVGSEPVGEAEEPVVWTNPNDLAFDPTKALPKMLSIDGKFSAAYCDGSVRTFKMPIDQEILKLLIQKNDGKFIPEVP